MNATRQVRRAAALIAAAQNIGADSPEALATRLDSAQMLQSPEVATTVDQLTMLAETATEHHVRDGQEPGLWVRRRPGNRHGWAVLEAKPLNVASHRRAYTRQGWRLVAVLPEAQVFCWPDGATAVAQARTLLGLNTPAPQMPAEASADAERSAGRLRAIIAPTGPDRQTAARVAAALERRPDVQAIEVRDDTTVWASVRPASVAAWDRWRRELSINPASVTTLGQSLAATGSKDGITVELSAPATPAMHNAGTQTAGGAA